MKKIFFILLQLKLSCLSANYVSLAPSVTETLFAVGLGEKVSGVSQYCEYPAEVKLKPRVGTPFTPNLEKLISLSPKTIFTQNLSDNSFLDKMKKLKLSVKSLSYDSYDDILKSIHYFSKLAKNEKGKRIIEQFKSKETLLRSLEIKGDALIVIEAKVKHGKISELMIAGPSTYLGNIISMTGLRVQLSKKDYSYLQIERFLLNPPRFLYLIKLPKKEQELIASFVEERKLKGTQIIALDKNYANIPGPRVQLLMGDIFDYHKN